MMRPQSHEETAIKFGHTLFSLRTERNWVQQKVADDAGISQPTVSDIECAVRMPTLHTARRLAIVFGMTLSELLRKAEL